jgi:hypothetical protein
MGVNEWLLYGIFVWLVVIWIEIAGYGKVYRRHMKEKRLRLWFWVLFWFMLAMLEVLHLVRFR